jgi:glycosyltransferase involved in cell wall biosynthesis
MQFSVLLSLYIKERPEFLRTALQSVFSQTLRADEVVLVLDGPISDELQTVVDEFARQYSELKVIPHPTNQGLGKALNLGLQHCSHEIIARMDTDDISVVDRFEKQIGYMKEHPDVAIISSAIDEFADDWHKPIQVKTLPLSHEELYKMAKFRNPINHMAAMMRRDEILRIGSYRHIPYVEDYELWVRALINGLKIANLADVLVHARVGNGMVKRRGTKKYIKSWHIMNKEMLSAKMINGAIYVRNMLSIIGFVYMPNWVKEILYKYVLRK